MVTTTRHLSHHTDPASCAASRKRTVFPPPTPCLLFLFSKTQKGRKAHVINTPAFILHASLGTGVCYPANIPRKQKSFQENSDRADFQWWPLWSHFWTKKGPPSSPPLIHKVYPAHNNRNIRFKTSFFHCGHQGLWLLLKNASISERRFTSFLKYNVEVDAVPEMAWGGATEKAGAEDSLIGNKWFWKEQCLL